MVDLGVLDVEKEELLVAGRVPLRHLGRLWVVVISLGEKGWCWVAGLEGELVLEWVERCWWMLEGGSSRLKKLWICWAQESSFDYGHRHSIM